MYIRHAENLARGAPYTETGYIYNPQNPAVGPRAYPPGFPLLLAPIVKLFGRALWPMKALIVASLAGSLVLLLHPFRGVLPSPYLEALVLITGLNPVVWEFKDRVGADLPFLFFVLVSLACLRAGSGALTGFFTFASYATRVLGVVLVPTFLAHDLIAHRRVRRSTMAACAVFIVLAVVQHLAWVGDRSYLDQLTVTAASVGGNLVAYARSLSDLWANGYSEAGRKALFVAASGLAALGYLKALRAPGWPEVFPWLYVVPVIIWPSFQDVRFLIPVVPFYVLYLLLGARVLDAVAHRRWGKRNTILAGLVAAVAVTYAGQYSTAQFGRFPTGVGRPESVAFFEFIKEGTDSNAVFVFSKPRALAFFTGRRASAPFSPADPCLLWRYMAEIGASYVVTGPDEPYFDVAYLHRFVDQYREDLPLVWQSKDVAVYRIKRNSCGR